MIHRIFTLKPVLAEFYFLGPNATSELSMCEKSIHNYAPCHHSRTRKHHCEDYLANRKKFCPIYTHSKSFVSYCPKCAGTEPPSLGSILLKGRMFGEETPKKTITAETHAKLRLEDNTTKADNMSDTKVKAGTVSQLASKFGGMKKVMGMNKVKEAMISKAKRLSGRKRESGGAEMDGDVGSFSWLSEAVTDIEGANELRISTESQSTTEEYIISEKQLEVERYGLDKFSRPVSS